MDKLGNLSEFRNEEFELYKSSDLKNTGIYWTDHNSVKDKDQISAYFTLLIVDNFTNGVFLKYPNAENFVQLYGGSTFSGRGNMQTSSFKNIWGNEFSIKIDIKKQEPHLLLSIGESLPEFNFMTMIARNVKPGMEYMVRDSSSPAVFGTGISEVIFFQKYLKLPEDVRRINYACKNDDGMIIVDCPAYQYSYDKFRFRIINEKETVEHKIKHISVFRDGGTTIISLENDMIFNYPSRLKPNGLKNFAGKDIEDLSEEEKQTVAKILKMKLVPANHI